MSEVEIPTVVVVLAVAGIVGFFVLLIWSMKRHRDPKLEVDCDAPIEELLPSLAGHLRARSSTNSVKQVGERRSSTP